MDEIDTDDLRHAQALSRTSPGRPLHLRQIPPPLPPRIQQETAFRGGLPLPSRRRVTVPAVPVRTLSPGFLPRFLHSLPSPINANPSLP
jgi:hypothetical protein